MEVLLVVYNLLVIVYVFLLLIIEQLHVLLDSETQNKINFVYINSDQDNNLSEKKDNFFLESSQLFKIFEGKTGEKDNNRSTYLIRD